jgi:hypothetical protein
MPTGSCLGGAARYAFAMGRLGVCCAAVAGAATGVAVFLVSLPAAVPVACAPNALAAGGIACTAVAGPVQAAPDPVMGAAFAVSGAFLTLLVAAGPWLAVHMEVPYRDPLPPPGWRGRREP